MSVAVNTAQAAVTPWSLQMLLLRPHCRRTKHHSHHTYVVSAVRWFNVSFGSYSRRPRPLNFSGLVTRKRIESTGNENAIPINGHFLENVRCGNKVFSAQVTAVGLRIGPPQRVPVTASLPCIKPGTCQNSPECYSYTSDFLHFRNISARDVG